MIALTGAALAVAGVFSVVALRVYLLHQTDSQLRAAGAIAQQRVGVLDGGGRDTPLRAAIAPTEYVVELRLADGQIERVSGPASLRLGALLDGAPAAPADGSVSAPATVVGGDYRAVSVQSKGARMAVALPLAPVHQTVRQLAVLEVSGGAAVLVLLGVFARLLLARGMRPLEQITVTATAIADGDLDRRVPVSGPDARVRRTEVGRLTLAVNGMLARIQDALGARARSEERLRRFVADASHELRTPLTSIRGYLQLLRHGIVAATGAPDMLRRADEEAVRMASIVDDLLYLARLDAEPALRHDRVDLAMVVRESLADALAVEPGRPATLAVPEECPVFGDEDALRQVMANLLANVRTHTPAGTPAEVRLTRTDAVARVEVVDHGPGIPTDVAQRAFDRFSRGDTGRGSGGSGLGLAIVAEILTAHRGEVHLESAVGAGTTVWFTVPMTDS